MNSECYTIAFWNKLCQDVNLFESLSQGSFSDMIQETDLISVRDLYKRIKEILSQNSTERIFRITDDQLLKLHSDIDAKFE